MADALINNPILNSPYEEPSRHFRFSDDGITNEIVNTRRISSYFIPIPQPKKKGKQLKIETEWTLDRVKENDFVNRIRRRVGMWRQGGHVGVWKDTEGRSADYADSRRFLRILLIGRCSSMWKRRSQHEASRKSG